MIEKITTHYTKLFGKSPEVKVKAPGRINLIGEHTDYNLGFVLPAAINKYTFFIGGKNNTERAIIHSLDYRESMDIPLDEVKIQSVGWMKYMESVLSVIADSGHQIGGFNMVILGDIPIGAGVSSSAALTCGLIYSLNELFELDITLPEIALMAQQTEIRIGLNCGLMDQYAVLFSKKEHCLFLDCRSLKYDHYPADFQDYSVLLLNTNVKHNLADSEYNNRRKDVEKVLAVIKKQFPDVESVRDVERNMLQAVHDKVDRIGLGRVEFVIAENERVLKTCKELEAGNLEKVGNYINASHDGLSNLYQVSCPELDFLAAFAQEKEYVLGSRMMGGGFGGCTINLVKKGNEDELIREATAAYQKSLKKTLTANIVGLGEGTTIIND